MANTPLTPTQIQHLHLAGTVSIPRHFPELGRIWYLEKGVVGDDEQHKTPVIRVEHTLTHGVSVTRSCLRDEVRAIFIPKDKDPDKVDLKKGRLVLGSQIHAAWPDLEKDGEAVLGIVYVHEAARVHTEVSMGMTAAQSIEYAPPLGAFFCE